MAPVTAAVNGWPSAIDLSFGGPTILTTDGKTHEDLRASMDTKCRPRTVSTYIDDLVTPIVDERLAALSGRASVDLLTDYLEPISVSSPGHGSFWAGCRSPAARGQMAIAVRRLLGACPGLRLEEPASTVFQGWEFRAPTSLVVRLS